MLLAIDSGNTNTVFGVFDEEGVLKGEWRSSTDMERTADDFGVWLKKAIAEAKITPEDITASIIASVVPATLPNLETMCRTHFACDAMVIGEDGVDLGLKVLTDHPEEVGADRLVNAVAAHHRYGGPLVIVDFGTATTFDIIDADGSYLGGIITPGVNLSLETLHRAAAQLPLIAVQPTERVTGKNTVEAMQSGMFWGYVSMIEGLVKRLCDEHGADLDVVATGGLARMFEDAAKCIKHSAPDLTLAGLYDIYRKNS